MVCNAALKDEKENARQPHEVLQMWCDSTWVWTRFKHWSAAARLILG